MTTSRFYVPASTKPGDHLNYRDLESSPRRYGYGGPLEDPITQELHLIGAATYGDYDRSCDVERSNYRVLTREGSDTAPHLVTVSGGYGSTACGFLGSLDDAPEPVRDALAALENYPILDEMDCIDMEHEMGSEAWESYGKRNFQSALASFLEAEGIATDGATVDLDFASDDAIFELWREGCEAFNLINLNGGPGFHVVAGGTVHFYTREWFSHLEADHTVKYHGDVWRKLEAILWQCEYRNDEEHAVLEIACDARLEGREAESATILLQMRSTWGPRDPDPSPEDLAMMPDD